LRSSSASVQVGEAMRVVMLTPPPEIRGPLPKLVPVLAASLREQGCAVTLRPWGRRGEGESLWRKLAQRPMDIWRTRRQVRADAAEVVVVHTAHSWATLLRDVPLLLALRAPGRVLVLHLHGSLSDRLVGQGQGAFTLASAILVALSDAVLVLSSEEQHQWQAFRPDGRIRLVRNPLPPPPSADAVASRERFGIARRDAVVLFVGRLIAAKGILELLAVLTDGVPPFHLLVVGEGPLEAEIRRRAAAAGVGSRLTLTGYLEGAELQAAYAIADLFVLPTAHSEGLPLVILEAMAAGLPIVTTPMRGMADHLRDERNALMVPAGDRAALATAVARLVADGELRRRLGAANRDEVGAFSPERVGRDYLAALREALDARRGAG
jgi:glycosyltransferase involved in cell wall biosynthesis